MALSKKLLYTILIPISLLWTSSLYFYDFPQLFEGLIIQKFGVSTVEVSFLYTITSLPNLISNIFAGILIQSIGVGVSSLIFQVFVFFGIFSCYLGVSNKNFGLILLGRAIFGIGFDTVWLSQSVAAGKWFSGSILTVACGLNRSTSYLFSGLSTYLQPEFFYMFRNLEFVMFIYAGVAFFGFIFAFIFMVLDWKNEEKLLAKDEKLEKAMKKKFTTKDFGRIKFLSWMLICYQAYFSQCYYQCMNFMTDMLINRYGLTYIDAKNKVALIPLISLILIPLNSSLAGKFGKKGLMILMAALVSSVTYISMLFLPYGCSSYKLIFFVSAFSFFRSIHSSIIWPCMIISLPKQACSFMLGIAATAQNLLLAGMPLLFGHFIKERNQMAYQRGLFILAIMSSAAVLMALIIFLTDLKTGQLLHLPENDERVKKLREIMIREFSEEKKNLKNKEEKIGDEYKSLGKMIGKSSKKVVGFSTESTEE